MPIIGITGGFGTGKTFVASLFKKLGAEVIDADRLAHQTLKKGSATYKKIVAVFGKAVLDTGGSINRDKLGRIVFDNKKKLARLNRIIHPVVIKQIKKRIRESKNDILALDAPLICETNLPDLMDVLVVVRSSRQKQIERCVKKFNMEKKDVCKRMACQMPLKAKISKADYVVDNDGTRKETKKKVNRIWQELKPFGKSSGLYPERGRRIKKGVSLWR